MISNMNESLGIPQNILVTRNEVLEKIPETSKRVLKAYIQGIQLAKFNKKEAIKAGYDSGLQGEPDIVSAAWDLYSPGLTSDLSIVMPVSNRCSTKIFAPASSTRTSPSTAWSTIGFSRSPNRN